MPFEEAVMEDTVPVDEDEVVARTLTGGAIDDDRFSESAVLLPHMSERVAGTCGPVPGHSSDRLVGAVVREHNLEIAPRLVFEALKDECKDHWPLEDRNHQ
jgi:hypothetical protein